MALTRRRPAHRNARPNTIPFRIICPCGEAVTGRRTSAFQVATCPSCGNSTFVLPISPLSSPTPPPEEQSNEPVRAGDGEKVQAPRGRRRSIRGRRRLAKQRLTRSIRRAVSLREWFTIPKLVLFAAIVIVVLTGVWNWNRYVQQRLRERATDFGSRGLSALRAGDIEEATELLDEAAADLNRLEEQLPDAPEYQQAHRQTDLVAHLLTETLDQSLTYVASDPKSRIPQIQGRAVIFDATVEPTEGGGGYRMLYTPFANEDAVRVDLDSLELLRSLELKEPKRLLFGARIEWLDQEDSKWVLRLQPGSGVFITEPVVLEYLGLADDELLDLARSQQKYVLPDDDAGSRQ